MTDVAASRPDADGGDPLSPPDHPAAPIPSPWLVRGVFLVIIAWMTAAAAFVQIEYYDGLSAIVNARYFLNRTPHYIADRAPMMAFWLMPAELARTALGLHPLDVRPYHFWLVLFHAAYLTLVYRLMARLFGHSWLVFAAWVAAIPSFVFFSYSPFVSHDIVPGVLLLSMLVWCDRFFDRRSPALWVGLVVLGSVAALVKQTFGVFWVLLLLAALFQYATSRTTQGILMRLACGAMVSGGIVWLVLGWIFHDAYPDAPLFVRPLRNLQYLSSIYDGKDVVFPLWIYLRNAPAYGWLSLLLVVPGLVLSMRGTRIQQSIAVAWMGGLVFLHLLPLREVRYAAFLAPLTACLLVPALRLVAQRKIALTAAMLVLGLDLGRGAGEAAQVFHPFYRSGIERHFFSLLDDPQFRKRPILVDAPMMSFVAPVQSPLAADRYHRIFHFGIVHLRSLYECQDLRILADERSALRLCSTCPEGSLLIHASQILARGPTWSARGPDEAGFTQSVAICRRQVVTIVDAAERDSTASDTVTLVRATSGDDPPVVIRGKPCTESAPGELFPVLQLESTKKSYWLRRTGPDAYAVVGMRPADVITETRSARINRFEIVTP